jgi:fucose permease
MTDVQASLGLHQLGKLDAFRNIRAEYATVYDEQFADLAALFLLAALVVVQPVPQIFLFGLVGVCYGPVYPTIVAIGGELFPDRLNRISSALSAAGVSGSLFYPPLMGLIADTLGLRIGMIGAALLAIPIVLSLNMVRRRLPGTVALMERG